MVKDYPALIFGTHEPVSVIFSFNGPNFFIDSHEHDHHLSEESAPSLSSQNPKFITTKQIQEPFTSQFLIKSFLLLQNLKKR